MLNTPIYPYTTLLATMDKCEIAFLVTLLKYEMEQGNNDKKIEKLYEYLKNNIDVEDTSVLQYRDPKTLSIIELEVELSIVELEIDRVSKHLDTAEDETLIQVLQNRLEVANAQYDILFDKYEICEDEYNRDYAELRYEDFLASEAYDACCDV